MRKKYVLARWLLLVIVTVLCLSSCEKTALAELETPQEANSVLQVRTRAGEDAAVSYPVHVYVFKSNQCEAVQTIEDESQMLSLLLVEGTYVVYAIGGASAEDYDLPSKDEATPSMVISLKEGKSHGDVMVAKSNVTLVDGGTNTLTLALERKVMLLQSVILKKIPSSATSVSVTLSPLWKQIAGTAYEGEDGTETIPLTRESDGSTWSFSGARYLLPPSENPASITVNIVKPDGTSSYTYNTSDQLDAGYKINIEGIYTEAIGVTLTGTLSGAAWKSERTISFEFDESGTKTAEEGNGQENGNGNNGGDEDVQTGTVPSVGSTYKTCYVVSVTETNGISEVLLLSPNQKTMNFAGNETAEQIQSLTSTALSKCTVDGINGWRLMTYDEANAVCNQKSKIPNWEKNSRYLIDRDGTIRPATFGIGQITVAQTFKSTDILRPVATIKIQKN